MTSGFLSRTNEYRWPVVAAGEPKGIRTIRGFVTIFEYTTKDDVPLSYRLMFSDAEGRPIQSFVFEDLDIFYDAAQAALVERGLLTVPVDRPIAGDIIRDSV